MQADDVVQWLKQNPEFFDDFADDIAQIFVPHNHGGHAVSLAERQLLTLRDRNRQLEGRLSELLQFGVENDSISDKLHQLTVDLMKANDLASIIGTLEFHLKERFTVPFMALRLWLPAGDCNLMEFSPVGEAIHRLAENLVSPYCGPYVTDEVLDWFEIGAGELKSFAQFALKTGEVPFGILVMASPDSERFYPDMGTLYLQRLSELVSAAVRRVTTTHAES
ncbi:DUF484 family protein [Chitinibacter bivalviorum]|uniref:DUF484 family protein n=1 Tax=Chitinibacter bivalviorum TaxID=2739434 RepID=A0A7H9BK01_9NEIS|nr:DUF484 family protein [Chitinibacter bivalviorum]QLG87814.1 DUF484 family protein [Chitinibacter bivalviorum]